MDSKLRKTAIILALLSVLLISALVLWNNRETGNRASRGDGGAPKPQGQELTEEKQEDLPAGQIGTDLKAFERDPAFFDPERDPYLEELLQGAERVSVAAVSVERDLRIRILNDEDQVVSGESFLITVEGLGEYKDLDQDGILYLPDLEPGSYKITLQPLGGFWVPEDGTQVRVKDRLEYRPIDDISLFIRTQDEVDPDLEDLELSSAIALADDTEITHVQRGSSSSMAGVDVSKRQGSIDWEQVKESGIAFALIRTGYRGAESGDLIADPCFEENLLGALEAGLEVGLYFYSRAVTEREAVEEASAVLALLGDREITLPVYVDMEGTGEDRRGEELTPSQRTAIALAFCRTIRSGGREAGIYAGRSRLEKDLDAQEFGSFSIWMGEHTAVPGYEGYYDIWQYTSRGEIPGIRGECNLNIRYLPRENTPGW